MASKSDQHQPFHTLEVQPPAGAGAYSGPGAAPKQRLGFCAIAWMSVTTLIGVIGLILACWATNEVRTQPKSATYLVAKPWDVPKGYTVFPLGSGLGYWTREPEMLHGRSDHGVVQAFGRAYLIGGLSNNSNGEPVVINSTVRYNPTTGVILPMASIPEPRYRFAYARINDSIYVMGGTWSAAYNATPVRSTFKYVIPEDRWERMADMREPRFDCCAGAVNGKIYVTGGYNESYNSLRSVEEYDPATNTWTRLFDSSHQLKVSRGDCRAAVVGNKLYVMGGVEFYLPTPTYNCSTGFCYRFLNSMEAFDPATKTWTTKASMHTARGDFAVDVLPGGRIFVAGGEAGSASADLVNQVAQSDVEEYVVADDVWVKKAPLPEARFRADAAAIGDRVFIFGGTPSCGFVAQGQVNATECYNTALSSVYGYHDMRYPNLYTYYKE